MKTDQMPPMISNAVVALFVEVSVATFSASRASSKSTLLQTTQFSSLPQSFLLLPHFFASMPALISFILTLFLLAHHGSAQRREHAAELRAVKGQVLFLGRFYGLSNGCFYSFLYTCCIPPTSSLRQVSQSEECGRLLCVCCVRQCGAHTT